MVDAGEGERGGRGAGVGQDLCWNQKGGPIGSPFFYLLLARICQKAGERTCSAGRAAGCSVGLPTQARRRLLRHGVYMRQRSTGLYAGGRDAASTPDQEVGATKVDLAVRNAH